MRRSRARRELPDLSKITLRLPDPTRIEDGELSKSTRTRKRIMESAVDCLAETGYAGTTTTTVSERAQLTRTAMLYHFPSRMLLIEAVIYYILRERLQLYIDEVKTIEPDDWSSVVDIAWDQLQTNIFRAFSELLMASRTDPDLSAIFSPALAEYDRGRREVALATYPERYIDAPWFTLRRDVFRFLLEGLALQGGLSYNPSKRKNEILGFLKALAAGKEGEALLNAAIKPQRNT
ncbi:MAG TPA: TetR/AcrR family transcriptional regulator [Rhizomicrobium sp.]|nr:TetR/AcrR family transcriptional regulator [Rhizomicrobium sp.]